MASKVIIVTGASRGIGLAVAQSLLNASHKVVLVSRSTKQLEKLKERFPSQVAYLGADLTVTDVRSTVSPGDPEQHWEGQIEADALR